MKRIRLEDLNKGKVFTKPPDGYFQQLPGIIQSKTAHKTSAGRVPVFWVRTLKLFLVAALLVLIALYSGLLTTGGSAAGSDDLLAEVNPEDIISYLEDLEISSNEILEEVDLKALSLELENMDDPLLDNLDLEDEALIRMYDADDLQDSLL